MDESFSLIISKYLEKKWEVFMDFLNVDHILLGFDDLLIGSFFSNSTVPKPINAVTMLYRSESMGNNNYGFFTL